MAVDADLMITSGVDTSGLASGLDAARSAVQSAAGDMASALNGAQPSVTAFGDAVGGLGSPAQKFSDAAQAIIDRQDRLEAKAFSLRGALGELQTGFDQGTVSAEALQRAQDQLDSVMQKAYGTIEQTVPALHEESEAATEAESGLKGMAQQLLALGEALAITEGLKEFAQEALSAYSSVQQFSASMEALTGSAEDAEQSLLAIEHIAATQPFSFSDLSGAAQKLAAFGVEASQIPDVLQAAGEASRATGNSFDAVAAALSRVQITGQVSNKQLVQLGISWKDIADAAGVSVDEIQAKLKKGGQDAEADLSAILAAIQSKFSDFAEVPLSIGQQWQVLENQIHQVFVGIGAALAPVAAQMTSWLQSDVIPNVKAAVDAFNALPVPVKDVAVAMGLLLGATAPVAVALAGFGLAMSGLREVVPAATGLLHLLTGATGEVAVAETSAAEAGTAMAASQVAVGEAAAGATPAVAALGTAAAGAAGAEGAGVLATGAEGAATAMGGLAAAAATAAIPIAALGGVIAGLHFTGAIDAIGQLGRALQGLYESVKLNLPSFESALADLDHAVASLGIEGVDSVSKFAAAIKVGFGDEIPGILTRFGSYVKGTLADVLAPQAAGLRDAFKMVSEAVSGVQDTVESLGGKYTVMEKAAASGLAALAQANAQITASMSAAALGQSQIQAGVDKLVSGIVPLAAAFIGGANAAQEYTDKQQQLTDAVATAQRAVANLKQQQADGKDVTLALALAQKGLQAAQDALTISTKEITSSFKDLMEATLSYQQLLNILHGEQATANAELTKSRAIVGDLASGWKSGQANLIDLNKGFDTFWQAWKNANPELAKGVTNLSDSAKAMSDLKDATKLTDDQLTTLLTHVKSVDDIIQHLKTSQAEETQEAKNAAQAYMQLYKEYETGDPILQKALDNAVQALDKVGLNLEDIGIKSGKMSIQVLQGGKDVTKSAGDMATQLESAAKAAAGVSDGIEVINGKKSVFVDVGMAGKKAFDDTGASAKNAYDLIDASNAKSSGDFKVLSGSAAQMTEELKKWAPEADDFGASLEEDDSIITNDLIPHAKATADAIQVIVAGTKSEQDALNAAHAAHQALNDTAAKLPQFLNVDDTTLNQINSLIIECGQATQQWNTYMESVASAAQASADSFASFEAAADARMRANASGGHLMEGAKIVGGGMAMGGSGAGSGIINIPGEPQVIWEGPLPGGPHAPAPPSTRSTAPSSTPSSGTAATLDSGLVQSVNAQIQQMFSAMADAGQVDVEQLDALAATIGEFVTVDAQGLHIAWQQATQAAQGSSTTIAASATATAAALAGFASGGATAKDALSSLAGTVAPLTPQVVSFGAALQDTTAALAEELKARTAVAQKMQQQLDAVNQANHAALAAVKPGMRSYALPDQVLSQADLNLLLPGSVPASPLSLPQMPYILGGSGIVPGAAGGNGPTVVTQTINNPYIASPNVANDWLNNLRNFGVR